MSLIDPSWMPDVTMKRIIVHWTAGAWTASAMDRRAYHVLIEATSRLIRGVASIALNAGRIQPGYAAHTLNCNTDSIGVSMCAMAGAVESPFNAGPFPITQSQFDTMIEVVAELCVRYRIAVSPRTVLYHAEVQSNLGITQRGKWDVARLPFLPDLKTAKAVGDHTRRLVARRVTAMSDPTTLPPRQPTLPTTPPVQAIPPAPAGGVGNVTASSLNLRREPSINGELRGTIPRGTSVTILSTTSDGEWLEIRTPFGAHGFVARQHVEITDGPPPLAPTKPDPRRTKISEIRTLLDELEKSL